MTSYNLKSLLLCYLDKTLKYKLNDLIIICSMILKRNTQDIFLNLDTITLNKLEHKKIDKALYELIDLNVPFHYILGYKDFYKEHYIVNKSVLIPREDSEILVEIACKIIDKYKLKSMLDMCTGSGCLGISIANNSAINNVDMVDISKSALKVANENIQINNVANKCKLIHSDLFSNLDTNKKYDILVSNPPYIKTDVIETLSEDVKKEPILALDGGMSGIEFYRKILNECNNFLYDNAFLLFEIGYDEKVSIENLIYKLDYIEYVDTIKDYSNNDRVVICRFHQI